MDDETARGAQRRARSRFAFGVALALSWLGAPPTTAHADGARADALPKVRIAIEREGDLRLLPLWVGIGNGDFRRAGIELQPVALGPKAGAAVTSGETKLAALRPALWAPLVTAKAEVAIVAALTRDDDANVILARRVESTRGTTASGPLAARLDALRELRVGYVDVSARRLGALLGARTPRVQLIALEPDAADRAFTAGDVDALYAPSPWAERALVPGEGVLWIHASRGERDGNAEGAPPPIVSALVAARAYATSDEAQLMAVVKGLAAAEQLVHDERAAAVHALVEALPTIDRGLLEAAVLLYEPAVPRDPRVDVAGVSATLRGREPTIDVSTLELERSVDPRFAERAASATPKPRRFMKIAGAVLGVVVGGIVTFMVLYRKKSNERAGDEA